MMKKNIFNSNRKKGSIVAFLLILACFGLVIVFGCIAVELLVKWVTMSRIQVATQAGAMAFAREMVKVRDNEMGELASQGMGRNAYRVRFQETVRTRQCTAPAYAGCTPINRQVANITGNDACANFIECVNASQILLYELKNGKADIQDASQITDLTKNQCYIPANQTRFNKINNPPNCSGAIGNVISPVTQLDWGFEAGAYGAQPPCIRVAEDQQGLNGQKDFCVEAFVTARLDPIIAGGLPFLTGSGVFSDTATQSNNRKRFNPVSFITDGEIHMRSRAIVMAADFGIDETGAGGPQGNVPGQNQGNTVDFSRTEVDEYYRRGDVLNLSTETVSLEDCTSNGGQCAD